MHGASPNSVKDLGVMAQAEIDSANNKVRIYWHIDTNSYKYFIYKKSVNDSLFGNQIAELSGTTNEFTDTISYGSITEYKIERDAWDYWAYGYVLVSYDAQPVHSRGSTLILCDDTIYDELIDDLKLLKDDLSGDGYTPYIVKVQRSENFSSEKVLETRAIITEYKKNIKNLNSVILIGRIAVPYSGSFAVDGHSPDHDGAWPTDVFYVVDDNAKWTDTLINIKSDNPRIRNLSGDGKYDQTIIPAIPFAQLGRIDLFNLPAFNHNEASLIKRYLQNNHLFRNGNITVSDSSIVNDYFGLDYREGFAASGWSNFSPITGIDKISEEQLRYSTRNKSYLLAYGCGAGSFNSVSQVAYTDELAFERFNAAFCMFFGSYNGDWDSEDNILRATLAAEPLGLAVMWSGRPFWFLHHLAAGFNIGYSTKLSQSNYPDNYQAVSPYARRFNHIALMGDPTLRLHYHKPVDSIVAQVNGNFIQISWNNQEDSEILGYYIYCSSTEYGEYKLLNSELITENIFFDSIPLRGMNYYMIRSAKMKYTASGSYINLSTGKKAEPIFYPVLNNDEIVRVFPNPATNDIYIVIDNKILSEITQLDLFDISGNLIKHNHHIKADERNNIIKVSLSDSNGNSIPNGVYFISIKSGNTNLIKKIIKIIQ